MPPNGLIILFKGLSVCNPTITSSFLLKYPGSKLFIPATCFKSTSKIPFFNSCALNLLNLFNKLRVLSVICSKNDSSPIYSL